MAEPLAPQYDPRSIESSLYSEWEEAGYFRPDAGRVLRGERKPYVIVIPPPNVTAPLHMGHGLNNTIQDVLTRWRRMQGYEALWLPGTDHAGIATQNVVERALAAEGKTRDDLGRDAFVERVWEFVDRTGETILDQLKTIGCSCDWSRTRFTLEPELSAAVYEVFVRLYEKGLIYRGNRIINWCPRCLTALSDEEAEPADTQGKLYFLRYPLPDGACVHGRDHIVIATTRPETMLGDTAIAVHPADERYHALLGVEVELPLTGRRIPVVADEYVDPEFGTGAVKITPAHDPNDFELARRHDIAPLNVMTPEGAMNENAPEQFQGLDRFEARKRVVAAMQSLDLVEKIEDHTHSVPHCYRCDTVVEPRLSDQWFVRMKPLAEAGLAASREGRVRFTPERWTKVYEHWLENIHDWCISRQLWWGHRIPVWYCQSPDCGEMIVARSTPATCSVCGGGELVQDADVLDTWFSSWLWPFSTLGWPEETDDVRAFYPNSTLVSAYDIIFFWIARMIMAGLEFKGEVPFQDVFVTGLVRDHMNRKMSKSLGNGIDPIEVVEKYGADALRYTVVAGASAGSDLLLNYENLEESFSAGRYFANKLWNAGRFALMNLDDEVAALAEVENDLELADKWILSRLNTATVDVTRHLEAFRLHEAALAARLFFWDELADWYLELVKPRLRAMGEGADAVAPEPGSRAAAQATLAACLDGVLRLLHPVMPFITEALWQRLPAAAAREPSLVIAQWPQADHARIDAAAEQSMNALMELIGAVRSLRNEYGVPPSALVTVHLTDVQAVLKAGLVGESRALRFMARASVAENGAAPAGAGAHAVLRSGAELFIPLEGVIDIAREKERLGKERDRLEGQLRSTEAKLTNEKFTGRAPPEVVAHEREKAASLADQLTRLSRKLESLG